MQNPPTIRAGAFTNSSSFANRPADPIIITTTRDWARSGRVEYKETPTEVSTHESGTSVSRLIVEKHLLPDFKVVPARALQARALYKHDTRTNTTTLATLEEAMEYLYRIAPAYVPNPPELHKASKEATNGKNVCRKTYDNLHLLGKHMLKHETGFPWDLQAEGEISAQSKHTEIPHLNATEKNKSQTSSVRADAGLVLSHRDHTDVSDKLNEWFRADQLRLDTLPTSKHLKVKSAALITEFKKLRTNETDTSRRMTPRKPLQKKKLRTPKAIAAQALKDALNAVLVSQGVVASLQELEDREAMIADMDEWTPVPNFYSSTGGSKMMPAGRKSPVLFAQASVYAQAHRADTLILDDWSAPKALRFEFEPGQPNMTPTDKEPDFPLKATFSHLQTWRGRREPDDMEVTVEEAGMFFLADNLSLIEATWFPRVFVYPHEAGTRPTATQLEVAHAGPQAQCEHSPAVSDLRDYLASNLANTAATSAAPSASSVYSINAGIRGAEGVTPEKMQIRSKGVPTRGFHTDHRTSQAGPSRRAVASGHDHSHHPYA